MIYNNTVIHEFCEAKLTGGPPEYLNSITSLYMTFLALNTLRKRDLYLQSVSKIIYLLMAINGVASMLYHFNLNYRYKLADEYTMILPMTIGVANLSDKLFTFYKAIIFNLFFISFNIFIMIFDIDIANDTLFPMYFSIDCFFLFYLCFLAYRRGRDRQGVAREGVLLCTGSGIIWIITENLCEIMPLFGFFGHAIWHIGMPLGFHRIIIFMDKNF